MQRSKDPKQRCLDPQQRCKDPRQRCKDPQQRCMDPQQRCRDPQQRCKDPKIQSRGARIQSSKAELQGSKVPKQSCKDPGPKFLHTLSYTLNLSPFEIVKCTVTLQLETFSLFIVWPCTIHGTPSNMHHVSKERGNSSNSLWWKNLASKIDPKWHGTKLFVGIWMPFLQTIAAIILYY